MSDGADNHVELTIVAGAISASREGFGTIGLISHNCDDWDGDEFSRSYADTDDAAEDWDLDSPEYLWMAQAFGQDPKPPLIKVLNAKLNKPTQSYSLSLTPTTGLKNSHLYSLEVSGQGFDDDTVEYTSDSAATAAEVSNGMVDALNAVVDKTFTADFAALTFGDTVFTAEADDDTMTATGHGRVTGDGPVQVSNAGGALPTGLSALTDYWIIRLTDNTFKFATSLDNALAGTAVTISDDGTGTQTMADTANTKSPAAGFVVVGDDPGAWFSVRVSTTKDFQITQDHADADVDEDLAAIALEDDDWFWLGSLYNSVDYIKTVAAWAQSAGKMYYFASNDTNDLKTSDGSTGVGDEVRALAYKYAAGDYHPDPSQFADAAVIGGLAGRKIGSWTAKFKRRSGVTFVALTTTERANLVARQMNFYEKAKGISLTAEGTTFGDGVYKWIDNVVNIDWLKDVIVTNVFSLQNSEAKIPYTDAGAAMVEAQVRAGLSEGVDNTVITEDYNVSVPKMEDVSSSDRAARILPDVDFDCILQGAIHKVRITGKVSP